VSRDLSLHRLSAAIRAVQGGLMAIRDRFALALVSITVFLLPLLSALATIGDSRRQVDVVALWLAGALQLGLVLTWVFIPRLPKWVIAGWGLILIAAGVGFTIAAPIAVEPAGGSTFTWALVGLGVVGILTIIAAIVQGPDPDKAAL
jgi:hypothetical protein